MKVVLAKCPRAYRSHFKENSESLALGYLAANLRQAGFEVLILDAALTETSLEDLAERILAASPDLIGFTIADGTYLESTFRCADRLRNTGCRAFIILGGYTPTFQYSDILRTCKSIDAIARFEGEATIVELAEALGGRGNWQRVPGIAYREGDRAVTSEVRPATSDLDDLPFPARDNVPFILQHMQDMGVIAVSGSRGCYANCSFCSIRAFHHAQGGPGLRLRSVASIVDEVAGLVQTFGVNEILLVDDVFVLPGSAGQRRLEAFREELERRRLRVMFSISERASVLTDSICENLRRIGVRQALIGIEAATDQVLESIGKKTTVADNVRAIEACKRFDIDPTISFINFLPSTTLEHLRTSLGFLLALRVNFLHGLLNRFQIYPETALGAEVLRNGKLKGGFPHFEYCSKDARVDTVYAVVRRSLGLFLTIGFELKRVERKLRQRCFAAEESPADALLVQRARIQFGRLQQSVMEDASKIFESVLDEVEGSRSPDPIMIAEFVERHRARTRAHYQNWHQQLVFFEHFCPALVGSTCDGEFSPSEQKGTGDLCLRS